MARRKSTNASDVTFGSGNVFADLGVSNPEKELLKAKLAQAIRRLIRERGLSQVEAAALFGTDQARVSQVVNGQILNMTYDRLIRFLHALGQTVKFEIVPLTGEHEDPTGQDVSIFDKEMAVVR